MSHSVLPFCAIATLAMTFAAPASAQVDYRNLDAGRPTRIADATPTERRALEISLTSARFEKLTLGRYRLQLEPRVAYGILPRTEISLRAPVYFYERAVSPRAGLGGFGIGGEHQIAIETLRLPAIAFSGEAFIPTGPNALRTAFSGKALVTRTFSAFRAHINGAVASYSYRVPTAVTPIIPPFHGPCSLSDTGSGWMRASCSSPAVASAVAAAVEGEIRTEASWTAGLAIDHSFPLQSLMVVGDVYRQKYGGIGRPADWTAEVGARKQITRSLVIDGGVGRLFTGESRAWFLVFGTTFTRAGRL